MQNFEIQPANGLETSFIQDLITRQKPTILNPKASDNGAVSNIPVLDPYLHTFYMTVDLVVSATMAAPQKLLSEAQKVLNEWLNSEQINKES